MAKTNSKSKLADPPKGYYDKAHILIKGARTNNLKNVDLVLPKNKLIVVTGVSGSGKSSITMETLYAEGQRRYVESLSSYARQFLTRIKKPDVDYIKGISPAIAIHQKVSSANTRSTVGSMTEIFDYLRLLFARIGKTYSPISGEQVRKDSVTDIVGFIGTLPEGERLSILSNVDTDAENFIMNEFLDRAQQKGFTRVYIDDEVKRMDEMEPPRSKGRKKNNLPGFLAIVVDRVTVAKGDLENRKRIADSVEIALAESRGMVTILLESGELREFSTRFEADGMIFQEPSNALFNYNSSLGACPTCEGYGMALGIDEDKVIPNKQKSLLDHAIAPWAGEKGYEHYKELIQYADQAGISIHRPYQQLTDAQRDIVWNGNDKIKGIHDFFKRLQSSSYKIQDRVLLSRYRGKTVCPACKGKRLRPESLYVKVAGCDIAEITAMDIHNLNKYFQNLVLEKKDLVVAERILLEISNRLSTMANIGLGYLTLQRPAATLSGGETQRIHLTRLLGSNLTGSMYLLDEPSVGLHPRDTNNLIAALKNLRDLGNTVIIVEHEEEVIRQADYLVDMGPEAGSFGGEVVFTGNYEDIGSSVANNSLTIDYLLRRKKIEVPSIRRKGRNFLNMENVTLHNLQNVNVSIPLNGLVCVTGVSGSGKSSLIKGVLYPAMVNAVQNSLNEVSGNFIERLSGDLNRIQQVEMIDQQPIGKSSRSNPVTYVKAYDYIRDLYTSQPLAKIRGFKPKHFSFNVEGGRCENCKGDGVTVVDMQFLADVTLVCEECRGFRFKQEVLDVKYKDKSIYDVLEMDIREAVTFFEGYPEIINRIGPLDEVGLGYVRLGQSSSSLSGGEAQRVKLASFLTKEHRSYHTLFLFDEPTTGLHFEDVRKLLIAFNRLVENGHSIIVVEHNMEVIKCADYVVDIGPEGGVRGGTILYQGPPEGLKNVKESYTAQYLDLS